MYGALRIVFCVTAPASATPVRPNTIQRMEFDIRTLSVLQGMAWVVFALTTLVMARVHPKEAHLRDWALGAVLCVLGNALHTLGPTTSVFVSAIGGNVLLCVGGSVFFVALRGLLGQPRARWVPWAVLCIGVPPLLWATYVQPSFAARVVVVSLLLGAPLAASAGAVWCSEQTHQRGVLQWVNRLMLLVFVAGAGVFAWRLVYSAYNLAESKSIFASSPLYAAPYLWGLLYNICVPIAIVLTVSERLQRDLALARDRADADNEAKSRFLATMSHEIRTPMNGILGMAQMLQQPRMDAPARQAAALVIVQSGQTLLTLLNDILDLSKVEAGKLELAPVPFQPHQLVREIESLFAESARSQGLRLLSGWTGPVDAAYTADAMRLRQMLSNLVGNAIKFTPQGEVRIEAREVAHNGADTLLEFAVTDTGVGVSPEQLARLFKPFSQADNSITRQYGGSGLGLSIVRRLARLMGGDAGVQSQPGAGARFWFRVQAGAATAPTDLPVPVQPQATVQPPAAQGTMVLVAEDNAINRVVITAMLERLGLTPVIAEDGRQAAQALEQLQRGGTPPALVFMDIQMPVLDGLAATQRIRTWEKAHHHARVPIIALTANAYEQDRQRCLSVGMDDFLAKPVNFVQLQALIDRWMRAASAL